MKAVRRAGTAAIVLLVGLLAAVPFWRAVLTQRTYGASANCGECVAWATAGNDLWLAAFGVAALALSLVVHRYWLRRVIILLALMLAVLMLVDTLLLDLLSMRLHMADVLKFGGEGQATWGFLRSALQGGHGFVFVTLLTVLASSILLWFPISRALKPALGMGGLALTMVLVGVPLGHQADGYIHSEGVVNLLQLQRMRGVNTPYSPEFVRQVLVRNGPRADVCEAGQGRTPNVLLVIVESLSAHHSALLGGSDDVPELDAIARQNTWFSAFHANGFTTDQGLISLLDGRVPIPAVGRFLSLRAFDGFGDPKRSVVGALHPAGYEVAFFTTATLAFLDSTSWLKRMQVDHFEGSENAYYRDLPRGNFDAASDEALYGRFLQWLDNEHDATKPFFAALLTVESHPPFLDPATGKLDERAVFRRADANLANFYRKLVERGFFEHGILLITGDHRSMTAVDAGEWRRYGDSALARIPLIVAGASGLPRGEISAAFQQTDLLPSLAQLIAKGRVCRSDGQGTFLRSNPEPPDYVIHSRGDRRERIDVYYPDGNAWVELAGDASRSGGAHPQRTQEIAEAIHRDRIERGELPQDMAPLLMEMSRQRMQDSEAKP